MDQQVQIRARSAWKTNSATGKMMAGVLGPGPGAQVQPYRITGLASAGTGGDWIYALNTGSVGGIFTHHGGDRSETRWFHHLNVEFSDLALHPSEPWVAFSQISDQGAAHLGITDPTGLQLQTVTEGDSRDEAPSWVPGVGKTLVFQSAGIGRTADGAVGGLSPYHLQRLDLQSGELQTVLDDPNHDLLLPRIDIAGNLWYVRRPYRKVEPARWGQLALDVLLFPLRLLWALVSFLNVFSQLFSGKPLITAGPIRKEGPEPTGLQLYGLWIDAQKAEKEASRGRPAALVPSTWKLIRRSPEGREEIWAESVISYDLTSTNEPIHTDGSAIYHTPRPGASTELARAVRIQRVCVSPAEVPSAYH